MPREPLDYRAFERATMISPARRWELTNTRYVLAPTALLDFFNGQLDAAKHRFRIAAQFNIKPKPGVTNPKSYDQFTAVLDTNGPCAVFEFTGALPRARLYANWQVSTNDQATLTQLTSPAFDPWQTLLVANPLPPSSTVATNQDAGTVDFSSYAPKRIQLKVDAKLPCILLLNDKFDPNWKVSVDGKPAALLRCNYIMRGVQLSPGRHDIEFRFSPSLTGLYVSLAAIVLGLGLVGFLAFSKTKASAPGPAAPGNSTPPGRKAST